MSDRRAHRAATDAEDLGDFLLPQTEELFQAHWAVTWHASVGAAFSSDTFLITEAGPQAITPPEMWPLKRIRVQGADFFRPDLLLR